MAHVSFCGLGAMGAPMARRLLDAGHDLTVWNRTPSRAEPLLDAGASWAATPAEAAAAAGADLVITMLADPAALAEVVEGPDGIAAGIGPGATLVEMSTVGPEAVARVIAALPDGVGVLDAPVLGSTPQAEAGQLQVFVGGDDERYERWAPVLGALGPCRHVGPSGAGAAMKLVANATLGTTLAALGEVLALGEALGLERGAVFDVLSLTPLGGQADRRRSAAESGEHPLHFRLALAEKDLAVITDAARAHGRQLPLTEAARAWYDRAVDAGLGEEDYSRIVTYVADA
jgi:3-hydroxyisobutyrate dehydrogenase-like beta-hydroxyacid dehydrogenase